MKRFKVFAALFCAALAVFCLAVPSARAGKAEDVASFTNDERAARGLTNLRIDERLMEAAAERARECAVMYDHTRPDGSSFDTVLDEYGIDYRQCGENLYYDTYDNVFATRMVKGWMNSPPHRDNMLDPDFTHIGVGVYTVNGTNYGVQLFIRK